jgi:hypothetical protein
MDGPIVMNQKFLTTTLGFIFDCSKTEAPAYTFTAHMAPLGLTFYREGRLLKAMMTVCLSHFTVLGIGLSQLAKR